MSDGICRSIYTGVNKHIFASTTTFSERKYFLDDSNRNLYENQE